MLCCVVSCCTPKLKTIPPSTFGQMNTPEQKVEIRRCRMLSFVMGDGGDSANGEFNRPCRAPMKNDSILHRTSFFSVRGVVGI